MIMKRLAILGVALLCAAPAGAQTYVAATLGAELVKSYESTTNGTSYPDGDNEAISWGLRLGTAFGSRWGVELEFNRPGELDMQNYATILASPGNSFSWSSVSGSAGPGVPTSLTVAIPETSIFPAPEVHATQRNTTWNASAWIRQPLGARADLVVLGGLGFSRVEQEIDYTLTLPRARSYRSRTVSYGVGPMIGVEGRIRMTDHLELTPGFRVQSLGNNLSEGVVLRPSVALGWTF
jgi:hypothetical protein